MPLTLVFNHKHPIVSRKIADNGGTFKSLLLSAGVMASIVLLKLFPYSPIVMIVSIFFLDIGVQTTQITNFTRIYSLPDEVHNRVNTVSMTTYFIGGAIGTFFGLLCWRIGGWELSTWQMLLWSASAMAIILISEGLNKKQ